VVKAKLTSASIGDTGRDLGRRRRGFGFVVATRAMDEASPSPGPTVSVSLRSSEAATSMAASYMLQAQRAGYRWSLPTRRARCRPGAVAALLGTSPFAAGAGGEHRPSSRHVVAVAARGDPAWPSASRIPETSRWTSRAKHHRPQGRAHGGVVLPLRRQGSGIALMDIFSGCSSARFAGDVSNPSDDTARPQDVGFHRGKKPDLFMPLADTSRAWMC
jgi:hypothetical protein